MKKINKKFLLLLDFWLFFLIAITTNGFGVLICFLSMIFHLVILFKESKNGKNEKKKVNSDIE